MSISSRTAIKRAIDDDADVKEATEVVVRLQENLKKAKIERNEAKLEVLKRAANKQYYKTMSYSAVKVFCTNVLIEQKEWNVPATSGTEDEAKRIGDALIAEAKKAIEEFDMNTDY